MNELEESKIKPILKHQEKSKEELHNDLEEVELLVEKMKRAKSRKEKKQLLASFNKKQAEMFGSK